MRRDILMLLLALVALMALTALVANIPGYIIVPRPPFEPIEFPLALFVAGFIVLLIVLRLVLLLIRFLFISPRVRFRAWQSEKQKEKEASRTQKSEAALHSALLALQQGDQQAARAALDLAQQTHATHPTTQLLLAMQSTNGEARAEIYTRLTSETHDAQTRALGFIGLAYLARLEDNEPRAEENLARAYELAPQLKTLFDAK